MERKLKFNGVGNLINTMKNEELGGKDFPSIYGRLSLLKIQICYPNIVSSVTRTQTRKRGWYNKCWHCRNIKKCIEIEASCSTCVTNKFSWHAQHNESWWLEWRCYLACQWDRGTISLLHTNFHDISCSREMIRNEIPNL